MASDALPPFTCIVLAAQRTGVVNPLAERAGVSHKCLVPIAGQPLILYVLDTLTKVPNLERVRISVEPEIHEELEALLQRYDGTGVRLELTPSRPGIADSVLDASQGIDTPLVVTTADNVLLNRDAVNAVRSALVEADVVAAFASEAAIKAVHPEGQRNFYRFADGGYSNCNLYAVRGRHAFDAIGIFREGGQFMKNPRRLITAFGLFNILLMRAKLVSLHGAMKRMSKRFRLGFKAVVFTDGSLAIDVDNERTYRIAEEILVKRGRGAQS